MTEDELMTAEALAAATSYVESVDDYDIVCDRHVKSHERTFLAGVRWQINQWRPMTEEPPLHGSSIMEATIARHPELGGAVRIGQTTAFATSLLTAAMEALRPANASSIMFTNQRGTYWTCYVCRQHEDEASQMDGGVEVGAYGTGNTADAAYRDAMETWAAKNPEAPAG